MRNSTKIIISLTISLFVASILYLIFFGINSLFGSEIFLIILLGLALTLLVIDILKRLKKRDE